VTEAPSLTRQNRYGEASAQAGVWNLFIVGILEGFQGYGKTSDLRHLGLAKLWRFPAPDAG